MLKTAKSTSSPTNGHGDDLDAVDAGQGAESAQRGSDVTPLFAAAAGRNGAAASYPVEETVRSEIQRVRLDLLARETERLQQRLQQVLEERRQDRQVIDELRQQIEQVTQKGLLMAARAQPDGADAGAGAELDRQIKPLLKTLLQLMERAKQVPTTQGAVPGDGNPAPQAPAPVEHAEAVAAKDPTDGTAQPKPAPQGTAARPASSAAAPDAWGQIDCARDTNQSVATAPAEKPHQAAASEETPATAPEAAATTAEPATEADEGRMVPSGFTSLDDDDDGDDEEGLQRGDPGFVEVARLLRQPDPRTEARARRTEGMRARDLRHETEPAKMPAARPAPPAAPAAKAAKTEAPPTKAAPAKAAVRDESLTSRRVEAPAKPSLAEKPEQTDALLLGTSDTPRVDDPAITAPSSKARQAADPAPAASATIKARTERGSFLRARRTAPQPIKAHGLKGREDAVARRLAAVVDRATAATGGSPLDAKTAAEAEAGKPASPAPSQPPEPSAKRQAPTAAVAQPSESLTTESRPASKAEAPRADLAKPADKPSIKTESAVERPAPSDRAKSPAPPLLTPEGRAGKEVTPKPAGLPESPVQGAADTPMPARPSGGLGLTKDANPIRAALPKCLTEPWDEEDAKDNFLLGGGARSGGLRWPFRRARGGKAAEASESSAAPPRGEEDDEPKGRS